MTAHASPAPLRLALLALASSGCLVFDGLEPHPGGSDPGGGGAGGGPAATCRSDDPACLLDPLNAARTCATLAACPTLPAGVLATSGLPLGELDASGALLTFSFSSCIDWLTAPLAGEAPGFEARLDLASCLAASASCAGAEACLGVAPLDAADPRCAAMSGAACDFDALVDCDASLVSHCDKPPFVAQTSCVDGGPGPAHCEGASCGADGASCDADRLTVCASGAAVSLDCAALGLACDGTGCSGAPCATPYRQGCDGDAVTVCAPAPVIGPLEVRFDCAAVGRSCALVGDKARCVPAPATCSPFDPAIDVCDGTRIHVCIGGKPTDIDCAAFGFVCAGPSGATSGRCAEG